MKKLKRPFVMLLATVLAMSVCGATAMAEDMSASASTAETAVTEAPEQSQTEESYEETPAEEELTEESEEHPAGSEEEIPDTEPQAALEEAVLLEAESTGDIALGVVEAYFVVKDYTIDQAETMSRQELLNKLVDSNGEKMTVPESAEVVRIFFIDENGTLLQEECYELQLNETTSESIFKAIIKGTMSVPGWSEGNLNLEGSPVITIMQLTLPDKNDDNNTIPEEVTEDSGTSDVAIRKESNTDSTAVDNLSATEQVSDTSDTSDTNDTSDLKMQISTPKTGDTAVPVLWLALLLAACTGLVLMVKAGGRKRTGNQ